MKTPEDKLQSFEYLEKLGKLVASTRREPDPTPKKYPESDIFYPLVGVDYPPEGGILVWWQGIEKPTKTFPYKETVEKVDDIKKISMALLRSLTDTFRSKIKTILLLLFTKDIENVFLNVLQELDQILRNNRNDPPMFCRAVREVWRVFCLEEGKVREQVREVMCHILEYDDRYRYPFQDVIVKLDKFALVKNPIKEIGRLLDIWADKEGEEAVSRKPRMLKKMVWFLRFKPVLLKEIVGFLINLNLNELKLDEADQFHARKKPAFKWDFLAEKNLAESK